MATNISIRSALGTPDDYENAWNRLVELINEPTV